MIKELLSGASMKVRVKFNRELAQLKPSSQASVQPTPATPESIEKPGPSAPHTPCDRDLTGYRLPEIPPALLQALQRKDQDAFRPNKLLRSMLIEVLFDSIVTLRIWFPSRTGYRNVCNELKKEYAWLPGTVDDWKNSLIGKFKRERFPLVNKSSVAEMKQKFGRPGVSGRKRTLQPLSDNELHKRQRPQYVGEDDSDVGQLAEDAVTIRKHTDWLKREAGRQQLDKDGINHRLKKIKTQRREFLKVNSITDGLQEYPILRHRPWLVGEPFLQYGINSIGVLDQILAVLEKLENKIRYKCKLFDEYRQEKDNELQTTIDDAEKKDIMLLYVYRLLPSVFGEKEEYTVVASEKDIQSPAPVIVGTMQKGFNIIAEGERSYAASARGSDWLWRHGLQPFGCFV